MKPCIPDIGGFIMVYNPLRCCNCICWLPQDAAVLLGQLAIDRVNLTRLYKAKTDQS